MEQCKRCGKRCVREFCHKHGPAQQAAVKRYIQKHREEFNKYKRDWYRAKVAQKKELQQSETIQAQ